MNKNGVIAVVVVVAAIVLLGLWAMRSGQPVSPRADCQAAPGAPSNLAYTKSGSTVTVNWTPPTGETATTYVIEAGSRPGANDQATYIVPGNAATYTRSDVVPGTYYVRMFARNACGTSPPSPEIVVTSP